MVSNQDRNLALANGLRGGAARDILSAFACAMVLGTLGFGGCSRYDKSYVVEVPWIPASTRPAATSASSAVVPATLASGMPLAQASSTQPSTSTAPAIRPVAPPRDPVPRTVYLPREEVEKIWNDPEFQKQFIGSYGINSNIEPTLTREEQTEREKVRNLMSTDLDKAASELEMFILPETSANLDFLLGGIRFQQDKMDDALDNYRRAVLKFPNYRSAWKNMGIIYARMAKYDDAITAFTKLIELGGADAYSFGLLGGVYAGKQDYQAAEVAYRNALLLQPKSTEWRLGLTRCVYAEKKFEDTVTLLDGLIEQYPDKVDFWLLQANTFLSMKQPLRAAENLEAIDRMNKAKPDNLYMLGEIYVSENLPDLAVNAYGRAISKDAALLSGRTTATQSSTQPVTAAASQPGGVPADVDPQVKQAYSHALRAVELLASRGATGLAIQLAGQLHKAFDQWLVGTDRRTLLKLEARLSMAGGNSSPETAKVLEEIVSLDPLDGEALMLLAQHYGRQNDPERAIIYYERAGNIDTFEVNAKLRLAQLLVGQKRYSDSLPYLRRVQEAKPRDDVARYLEQVERAARIEAANRTSKTPAKN